MIIQFSRPFAIFAVQKLALIDYDVATRVSDAVAEVSIWGYQHDMPYIAQYAINGLQKREMVGIMFLWKDLFLIWEQI